MVKAAPDNATGGGLKSATPAAPQPGQADTTVPVQATTPGAGRATTGQAPPGALNSAAPPAPTVLGPQAQATQQQLARLGAMPAGDAAIELTQQLEAGLTPQNAAAYVQALLSTDNPSVERAAMGALAAKADGQTLTSLAAAYGATPKAMRGRILEVLESASNPETLQSLAQIAAADGGEKRSPVGVSALLGVAHLGHKEAVQVLLGQVTPANGDYALLALGRVTSPQGIEMIRAAAKGNKDSAKVDPAYMPALQRLAASL